MVLSNVAYVEPYNFTSDDFDSLNVVEVLEYFYNSHGVYIAECMMEDGSKRYNFAIAVKIEVRPPVVFDVWCVECQYEKHNCPWCGQRYNHDGSDFTNTTFDHHDVCSVLNKR